MRATGLLLVLDKFIRRMTWIIMLVMNLREMIIEGKFRLVPKIPSYRTISIVIYFEGRPLTSRPYLGKISGITV